MKLINKEHGNGSFIVFRFEPKDLPKPLKERLIKHLREQNKYGEIMEANCQIIIDGLAKVKE